MPASSSRGAGVAASCERDVRSAPVKRRKARFVEPVERVPPAFAGRVGAQLDGEIEREMGEQMTDGAERPALSRRVRPFAARERRHSAEKAGRGTADQPHMAIPLDPPGGAEAARPRLALAPPRKAFRRAAREGRAVAAQRALGAARLARTADGCAEV